jgi:hypothetical protein
VDTAAKLSNQVEYTDILVFYIPISIAIIYKSLAVALMIMGGELTRYGPKNWVRISWKQEQMMLPTSYPLNPEIIMVSTQRTSCGLKHLVRYTTPANKYIFGVMSGKKLMGPV